MRWVMLALAIVSTAAPAQRATVDDVDPFIGTGVRGIPFPVRWRRSGWCSYRPTPTRGA